MARNFYGGSGADVIARPISSTDDDLELALGVTYSVYDARTGGALVTDLQTPAGAPITEVTPDQYGVRFLGPDGMLQTLWLQNQDAPTEVRWAVTPAEWGAELAAVKTSVTTPITRQATAIDQVPVTIKGMAGQTAVIFRVLNSDDTAAFVVTPSSAVRVGPNVISQSGVIRAGVTDPSDVGFLVRGAVGQAGKYFRAIDDTAAEKFSVDNNGTISGLNLGGLFGIVGCWVGDAAEAVPTGLPVGTVILRRPAA